MFDVVFASLDCLPAHGMENKIILGAVSSNPMTCHWNCSSHHPSLPCTTLTTENSFLSHNALIPC